MHVVKKNSTSNGTMTCPTKMSVVNDDDPVTTGTTDVVDATDDIITTDWRASAMAEAWPTTGDASSGSTSVGWLVSSDSLPKGKYSPTTRETEWPFAHYITHLF